MRQLVYKRVHGEGVIDVGDRAQPADAHVRFSRAVFDSQVGDVKRHVGPAHRQLERRAIGLIRRKGRADRREYRALQPRSWPSFVVERGFHIHRRHRVIIIELNIVLSAPDDFDRASDLLR